MGMMNIGINLLAEDLTGGVFGQFAGSVNGAIFALRQFAAAAENVNPAFEQFAGIGIGAGAAMSLFVPAVQEATTAGGELQMGLTRLQIAANATGGNMGLLKQAVVDMATHSLYSTNDAAMAFSRMIEKGFSVQQVLYGFSPAGAAAMNGAYNAELGLQGLGRQAMAVGEIMQTDATTGADLLAQALLDFKDQGLSAADAANLLAGAFYNGMPSAADLREAIGMAGGAADTMGVSLGDLLTTLDIVAPAMGSASSAGASLSYMMRSMVNPTAKQIKEMEELGLWTVRTGPAFDSLASKIAGATGAGQSSIQAWSKNVAGLQAMYAAAQKAGMVRVGETFTEWATRAGVLNNKLFDSKGHFIGLGNAIETVDGAMKGMNLTEEEKAQVIGQLFNVRSGRAAMLVKNLEQFKTEYNQKWDAIHAQNALKDAQTVMSTWQGALHTFQTTVQSALGSIALAWFQVATPIVQALNNIVSGFNSLPAPVRNAVGIFLLVGAALSTIGVAVAGVVVLVTLLGAIFESVATVLTVAGISFGVIVGAAVLAGAAFLLLSTHGEQVRGVLAALGGAIQTVAGWIGSFARGIADGLGGVLQAVLPEIQGAAQWLGGNLATAIKAVSPFFSAVLRPAVQSVGHAFQSLAPIMAMLPGYFHTLGAVVGIVAGILGMVLKPVIMGVVTAFTWAAAGIALAMSGIGTIVMGVVNVIIGLFKIFGGTVIALLSGNFDKIPGIVLGGLRNLAHGVGQIIMGIITVVVGLFGGLLGLVVGALSGFVAGVIQWFTHLWDVLVGHSIVPDMINAIVNLFLGLPGRVLGAVAGFVGSVIGNFLQMEARGIATVANLAGQVAGHFLSMAGTAAGNAASMAGRVIGQFLSMEGRGIGVVASMAGNIAGRVGSLAGTVAGDAARLAGNFIGSISSLPGRAGGIIGDMGGRISGAIAGIAGQAFHWGSEIAGNIASGLRSMLGNISGAAGAIAGKIAGLLHHTTPDEGPLVDDDTWGLHLVQNLAGGMRQGLPLLADTATAVAATAAGSFTTLTPQMGQMSASYAARGGNGAGITERGTIALQLDDQQFAEVMYEVINGHLMMNGMSRAWR